MVKLIIQIPCFNEEGTLAETLAALPRSLPGIDVIETLVIDDGSTDRTADVARESGATYLLRFPVNLGLARAFSAGLDAALKLGADVIVNTDADHQYPGSEVCRLVAPIMAGDVDMVIGDRAPHQSEHFSASKRLLQRLGSWAVRQLSGTSIPDATSGFRAFSRRAALRLNVYTRFTYTLETIIQAGKKHIPIGHVRITTNPERRPSRLFSSIWAYLRRSISTMIRIYALYEPLRVFWRIGGVCLLGGSVIGVRFLFEYFKDGGAGHIQSLILAAVLVIVGFQTMLIGLVADLIGSSRALVEDALVRIREIELRVAADADDVQLASGHAEVVRLSAGDPEIVRLDPPRPRAEGGHGPR
jgi:glycosyltransferase involved in cell wall biosynthesis